MLVTSFDDHPSLLFGIGVLVLGYMALREVAMIFVRRLVARLKI